MHFVNKKNEGRQKKNLKTLANEGGGRGEEKDAGEEDNFPCFASL
jgi:hypothetical protein